MSNLAFISFNNVHNHESPQCRQSHYAETCLRQWSRYGLQSEGEVECILPPPFKSLRSVRPSRVEVDWRSIPRISNTPPHRTLPKYRAAVFIPLAMHGYQMAIARSLDCMCLALWASGIWLRYATQQNLVPSFPWIAPQVLHPGAIQGKGMIKFCHLATLLSCRQKQPPSPRHVNEFAG